MILTLMTRTKIQENGVAGTSAPHRSEEEAEEVAGTSEDEYWPPLLLLFRGSVSSFSRRDTC